MLVLRKTSIRFFKRFPTATHSGKMYIHHLFRYDQLQMSVLRNVSERTLPICQIPSVRIIRFPQFLIRLITIFHLYKHGLWRQDRDSRYRDAMLFSEVAIVINPRGCRFTGSGYFMLYSALFLPVAIS